MFAPQINFDAMNDTLNNKASSVATELNQAAEQLSRSNDLSPQALYRLQYQISQMQTILSAVTNVLKSEGDTLKQIANNIGS